MVRLTVTVAFMIFAYVQAAPAPAKVSLVKNSTLGLGLAGAGGKTEGVVQDNKYGAPPLEAQTPGHGKTDDTEVTLLDNVNTGAAFAVGDSMSTGVMKNNRFADNPSAPNDMFAPSPFKLFS